MTCPWGREDAAYVLAALSPSERLEFERHLTQCDDCARAVRQIAGLPGLLGRVDAEALEPAPEDGPVPGTVLPMLARKVRRARRRRVAVAAGMAGAVAASVVGVAAWQLDGTDRREPSVAVPIVTPTVIPLVMAPVGEVPVRASLGLEQVAWGTRLNLVCTYDPESVEYELPPSVDYILVVRTRGGRWEHVGSWRSVGGRTMRLAAATAADRGDIASVQVRTVDGRVVLELAA